MKKLLLILLSLLLALGVTCAVAETYTSGDWEYELGEDGTATHIEYLGTSPELVIPAEIDGYRVSCVGDREDDWGIVPEEMWQMLTSVTLPEGLMSSGDYAFHGCSSLTDVTLPATLTSIGANAFASCPAFFTVSRDSWAAQWCKTNGLDYNYTDALDWLLN